MNVLQEIKAYKKAEAAVRRIMEPKGRSQVVEVSSEILEKWKQKGGPRRELVELYQQCGCKKELQNCMHVNQLQ